MQDLCWLVSPAEGGNLGVVVREENISSCFAKLQKYIYKHIHAQSYRLALKNDAFTQAASYIQSQITQLETSHTETFFSL